MFVNFNFRCDGEVYAATVAVDNIIMIELCRDEIELVNGEIEYNFRLELHFKDSCTGRTIYETRDLDTLQKVHSGFCSVVSGGESFFLTDIGFIEPVYPQVNQPFCLPEDGIQMEKMRTLSDK